MIAGCPVPFAHLEGFAERRYTSLHWLAEETGRSIRRIWRRPGNFLHLALILAIGFGCVIGIFDVAFGMLHAAFPSAYTDRIAVATDANGSALLFHYDLPNPHLNTVFERAAEYQFLDANFDSDQGPHRIEVAMVSPGFFATLGVRIPIGHDFSGGDFPSGVRWPQSLPIILSHELWHTYFASSQAILNKPIELNIPPYRFEVIGVAPPNGGFPAGVDAWIPVHLTSFSDFQTAGVPAGSGGVVGLLKLRVSITAAEVRFRAWPKEPFFDSGRNLTVQLVSLRDFRGGELYRLGIKLWLASIFFLVLTIISALTVLHTEVETRQEEFNIRSAIGASPGRLFASLNLEVGLAVLLALVATFLVRFVLIRVTASYLSLPKEFYSGIRAVDLALAAGAAGVVFLASLLVQGIALSHSLPLFSSLRSEPIQKPVSTHRHFPLQIVPAAMILIVATLFVRSAYKITHVDPNVRPKNAFICEVSLPDDLEKLARRINPNLSEAAGSPKLSEVEREKAYSDGLDLARKATNLYVSEALNTIVSRPGVVSAGAISTAPYRGHEPLGTDAQYSPATTGSSSMNRAADVIHNVIFRSMTPGAIPALGMRLLYGRNFSGDATEDENTAIINQVLADDLGSGSSPMGGYIRIRAGGLPPVRIIGIVNNVREKTLSSQVWPTAYFAFSQYAVPDMDFVVRTENISVADMFTLIQTSVHSVSPRAAVSHFEPFTEMVESAGTLTRYSSYYLLGLALVSIFLAGACTSSKTLGEIRQRRHEIGIRMALGATPGNIIRMFVYSDLRRTAIASIGGALLAYWLSSVLSYLLYDVRLIDPTSYLLSLVTLTGCITVVQIMLLKKALRENPRDLI